MTPGQTYSAQYDNLTTATPFIFMDGTSNVPQNTKGMFSLPLPSPSHLHLPIHLAISIVSLHISILPSPHLLTSFSSLSFILFFSIILLFFYYFLIIFFNIFFIIFFFFSARLLHSQRATRDADWYRLSTQRVPLCLFQWIFWATV